jgi:hypothetical protein
MNIHIIAHMILMPLALALTVASVIVLRGQKANRLNLHRALAAAGGVSGIVAFGFVFALKAKAAYPHFQSPHAIAGAVTLVLLLTALIGGGIASQKKNIIRLHKITGKIALAAMLVTLVMGIARLVLMLK